MKLLISLVETLFNKYVKNKNWKLKRNNFLGVFFWQIVLWCDTSCNKIENMNDTPGSFMLMHQAWVEKKVENTFYCSLDSLNACIWYTFAWSYDIISLTKQHTVKQMSLLVFSYKFAYSHAFSNLMHFIDSKYMYHDRDHFHSYFQSLVI